jgi:exonuclease III
VECHIVTNVEELAGSLGSNSIATHATRAYDPAPMLLLPVTLGLFALCVTVLLWFSQVHPYAGPFNKTYKIIVGKCDHKTNANCDGIISLNVWNLPFRRSQIDAQIGFLAKTYPHSIILLQELWTRPNMDGFPQGTQFVSAKNHGGSQISAGLAILVPKSCPIRRAQCVSYSKTGASWDQLAAKGVLIVELESVFIVNTHMQSNDSKSYETADRMTKSVWLDQYRELVKILHSLGDEKPIILGGDFNRDIHNFAIPEFLVADYVHGMHTHSTQGQIDGFFTKQIKLGRSFFDARSQRAKYTDHVLVGHETTGFHF